MQVMDYSTLPKFWFNHNFYTQLTDKEEVIQGEIEGVSFNT